MAKKPRPPQARSPEQEEREEYAFWMKEIKRSKKVFEQYFERVKKIEKLYRGEQPATPDGTPASHRMNILWSNTQVLQPSMYSRTPIPNVARRFLNKDPVSRTASLICERNLATAIDMMDFDYPMKRVRDDFLLGARGVPRVKFKPEFGMMPMREPVKLNEETGQYHPERGGHPIDDKAVKEDEGMKYYETEPVEQVLAYGLDVDHVRNQDFLHEPLSDWTKVGWFSIRHLMRRAELVREFKDNGRQCELNKSSTPEGSDFAKGEADCAEVHEVWAKGKRKVIYLSDGFPDRLLRVDQDPLRLSGFFPIPRPMIGTSTTDSPVPVPDYALYQDQAEQIDLITQRITVLTKAIRAVGMYNSSVAALATLLDEGTEMSMIEVENWIPFAQSGGIEGNVDWFPIEQFAKVLQLLFTTRTQLRNDLYEVTGMADIVRGYSDPNATATAEQIKSNFASLRLQDKQNDMARISRDTLRLMAEIQCEHYPDDVLIEMSGIRESEEFELKEDDPEYAAKKQKLDQKLMAAVQLLKDDKLRTFKIDIETDATVAPDQQKEKEARVEFLTAVAPFMEKAVQVGQLAPQFVPLLLKMLDYGVRGFRTGRTLESAIEQFIDVAEKMVSEAGNNPNQQPQDPAAQAQAAEFQAKAEKAKLELVDAQAKSQVQKQENDKRVLDMTENAAKAKIKADLEIESLRLSIEKLKAENQRNVILFNKEVQLADLKIQQAQNQDGLKELQGMFNQPEPTDVDRATSDASLTEAQARKAEALTKLHALSQQGEGLGAVEHVMKGVPGFKKKGPVKKLIDITKKEDGSGFHATVDEIELADDDEEKAA